MNYRVVFVLLGLLTFGTPLAAQAASLEVSGWIPYWRTATGTADTMAHLNAFTTINPFGYTMKGDGTLFDAAKITQEPWVSLIAAAKVKKIRVIPTVMWGNGAAIDATLRDATKRRALEDQITAAVNDNNFDGIDIDFEAKLSDTKAYFSLFIKGLSQRLGSKKWLYCTIEARMPVSSRYEGKPPADATQYANDYVVLNKYCDRVNIMAYDQGSIDVKLNKISVGPYVPVADPLWVEKVLKLAAQTISKKKLVLGVPTYGYEYAVTPQGGGYKYDVQWAFNPKYGLSLATALGVYPVRNQAGELSFSYVRSALPQSTLDAAALGNVNVNGGIIEMASTSVAQSAAQPSSTQPFNIVWWSDAQAIKDKVALAKKLGVRGIAIFKIDGGEDPKMWSVLPKVR